MSRYLTKNINGSDVIGMHGWMVRLPKRNGEWFIAIGDNSVATIADRAAFTTRTAARAFVKDLAAHGMPGGRPVRYRCTLKVED